MKPNENSGTPAETVAIETSVAATQSPDTTKLDVITGEDECDEHPFVALTESIDQTSPEFAQVVTRFVLEQFNREILADEGVSFLTPKKILATLNLHYSWQFLNASGVQSVVTEDTIRDCIGLGGANLPWIEADGGLAYALGYIRSTPWERAALQTFLFAVGSTGLKAA